MNNLFKDTSYIGGVLCLTNKPTKWLKSHCSVIKGLDWLFRLFCATGQVIQQEYWFMEAGNISSDDKRAHPFIHIFVW